MAQASKLPPHLFVVFHCDALLDVTANVLFPPRAIFRSMVWDGVSGGRGSSSLWLRDRKASRYVDPLAMFNDVVKSWLGS